MSLIQDALKEMEANRPNTAAGAPAHLMKNTATTRPSSPYLIPGLVLLGAITLGGYAAWHYGTAPSPFPPSPAADLTPAARISPVTPEASLGAPLEAPPAPPTTSLAAAPRLLPSLPSTQGQAAIPPAPRRFPKKAGDNPNSSPSHAQRPHPAPTTPAASPLLSKPATPTPPQAPETTLEEHYARLFQAIERTDTPAAAEQLKTLERRLPPDNLAILRAKAWLSNQAGDNANARRFWQEILEHLPDDENASLNLAALAAREGRLDTARTLVSRVLATHPDSPAARRSQQQLDKATTP